MNNQQNPQKQFKYSQKQQIHLHPIINLLAQLTQQCQPYMPPSLTRKIAQDNGLDINQNIMCMMLSHICDYKVMRLMENVKQFKQSKKVGSGLKLSKGDIVKVLNCQGIFGIDRPNQYQLFGEHMRIDQQFDVQQLVP